MLVEYYIIYMTKKSVKDSAITNHLVDNTIYDNEPLWFKFLDEDIVVV
jgi:hypothetical protein